MGYSGPVCFGRVAASVHTEKHGIISHLSLQEVHVKSIKKHEETTLFLSQSELQSNSLSGCGISELLWTCLDVRGGLRLFFWISGILVGADKN